MLTASKKSQLGRKTLIPLHWTAGKRYQGLQSMLIFEEKRPPYVSWRAPLSETAAPKFQYNARSATCFFSCIPMQTCQVLLEKMHMWWKLHHTFCICLNAKKSATATTTQMCQKNPAAKLQLSMQSTTLLQIHLPLRQANLAYHLKLFD